MMLKVRIAFAVVYALMIAFITTVGYVRFWRDGHSKQLGSASKPTE